jgi:ribosome-associated toxin RatA of RatAB toxin-antitoxin module
MNRIASFAAVLLALSPLVPTSFAPSIAPSAAQAQPPETLGIEVEATRVAGTGILAGEAEGTVDASIDEVTAIVSNYASYREFMPHFRQSRVLSQRGDRAMVYMEVAILRDAHRLWAQMRVSTREENGRRIVDARMIEGNMTTFEARWELQPLPDGRTRARFRLMVDPDLPLPDSAVSSENLKFARKSIVALRRRIAAT